MEENREFTGAEMMNERQVARLLGAALTTVRYWRERDLGPRYFKFMGRNLYRRADVEVWAKATPVYVSADGRRYFRHDLRHKAMTPGLYPQVELAPAETEGV